MVKKWPKVDTGPGDFFIERQEALDLPALNVFKFEFDWRKVKGMHPIVSENGRGVVLVVFAQGVVVVKSSPEGAMHAFANIVADDADILNPATRVIDAESDEYASLRDMFESIWKKDAYFAVKISEYIGGNHILIQEAATRTMSLSELRDYAFKSLILTEPTIENIGAIIATDILLGNCDRFPLEGFWDNGNAENVLFCQPPNPSVLAIDIVCRSPTDRYLAEETCEGVQKLVSSVDQLEKALDAARKFIEKEAEFTLGEGGTRLLARGFQNQLRKITKTFDKDYFLSTKNSVAKMVQTDELQSWSSALDLINVEHLLNLLDIYKNSPLNAKSKMPIEMKHIEGPGALLEEVSAIPTNEENLVFFDFDRTLTNGLTHKDVTQLDRRIRGGQSTVSALTALAEHGASMYILTSRSPRVGVVDQLAASLRGPQKEIGSLFLDEMEQPDAPLHDAKEIFYEGIPLAYSKRTSLYACEYQKAAAIAYVLCEHFSRDWEGQATVYFFDDAVVNAYDVAARVPELLIRGGRSDLVSGRIKLKSFWWDPFLEETELKSMIPTSVASAEYSYSRMMALPLEAFGVGLDEIEHRDKIFKAIGGELSEALPKSLPPGKLKANKVQKNLAAFLFGGGKQVGKI